MIELEKERIRLEAERKRIAALIASLLKIKNEQLVVFMFSFILFRAIKGNFVSNFLEQMISHMLTFTISLKLSKEIFPSWKIFFTQSFKHIIKGTP